MPIWKGKGDIHDPGRYRGITSMSQALKLMERILDARVRDLGKAEEQMMDCLPSDKLLRRVERMSHSVLSIWKRHLTPCQENLHLQSRDGWRLERQRSEWLRKCTSRQQWW